MRFHRIHRRKSTTYFSSSNCLNGPNVSGDWQTKERPHSMTVAFCRSDEFDSGQGGSVVDRETGRRLSLLEKGDCVRPDSIPQTRHLLPECFRKILVGSLIAVVAPNDMMEVNWPFRL